MKRDLTSRRHFISAGTIGLTTSIAGCSDLYDIGNESIEDPDGNEITPPENDTAPDGTENSIADDPPALFKAPTSDYSLGSLQVRRGENPDPANLDLRHKDSSIFTIEIQSANSATATLEQTNVARAIDLRLNVRNASGTFQKTPPVTLETTDEDTFETHTIEFDLSDITLPRGAGSICELIGTDTNPNVDAEFIFKRHQFVGVPHNNGVNWMNTERVNHSYYVSEDGIPRKDDPRGVNGNANGLPAGHVEHIDGDNERTVFFMTRTPVNGEVFGVSARVDEKPYRDYINGSRSYQIEYGMRYECHYATEISHLQELGIKTAEAISGIGITDQRERLAALGDLIQMIPYGNIIDDDIPPTVVLYEQMGDCSNKAGLFAGIAMNDPWNIMPAFIRCAINGTGHLTVGLDVGDLGNTSDSDYTVAPSQEKINNGWTNTEYAFFDMTYDADIGERTNGVTGYDGRPIQVVYEGDFKHRTDRLGAPPNY
ncbi:hypothetical protein BRC97_03635 [Halobacteriales archaeon QS_6_71_20]|nr:MAG: hypothetical protein BRC97_03635 [Halobacteriales archaeon QS_6_71_20]